jgi:hypothetical protein
VGIFFWCNFDFCAAFVQSLPILRLITRFSLSNVSLHWQPEYSIDLNLVDCLVCRLVEDETQTDVVVIVVEVIDAVVVGVVVVIGLIVRIIVIVVEVVVVSMNFLMTCLPLLHAQHLRHIGRDCDQ